jgi:hypothetical protein
MGQGGNRSPAACGQGSAKDDLTLAAKGVAVWLGNGSMLVTPLDPVQRRGTKRFCWGLLEASMADRSSKQHTGKGAQPP